MLIRQDKKISIIIIIYKVAEYLEQCIDSVLAQTYENIEVILVLGMPPAPDSVDGYIGEDDGCEAVCEYYVHKDKRVKLIKCRAEGVAKARNLGLSNVTGELIGFVDGDDYIEPDMFMHLMELKALKDAQIAVCGRFYEFKNRTNKDKAFKKGPAVYTGEEALKVVIGGGGFFLHSWDKLYDAALWEGIVFPDDAYVEDRIVIDRVLAEAERVVYDPAPKYHYRERKGSMSKTGSIASNNMKANVILTDFVARRFPRLSQLCDRFIMYEYVTAIQNVLLAGKISTNEAKEELLSYQEELLDLMPTCEINEFVTWKLQMKIVIALNSPYVLVFFTKIRNFFINRKYKRYD